MKKLSILFYITSLFSLQGFGQSSDDLYPVVRRYEVENYQPPVVQVQQDVDLRIKLHKFNELRINGFRLYIIGTLLTVLGIYEQQPTFIYAGSLANAVGFGLSFGASYHLNDILPKEQ